MQNIQFGIRTQVLSNQKTKNKFYIKESSKKEAISEKIFDDKIKQYIMSSKSTKNIKNIYKHLDSILEEEDRYLA